jgi:uncharacterized protein YaaW (UPF0174 family)
MNKSKFLKSPLSQMEKEKRAKEFLNFTSKNDSKDIEKNTIIKSSTTRILKKEPVKALALRFPMSLADDIAEISAMSGLSMNAICVELLRSAAKQKLRELKNVLF